MLAVMEDMDLQYSDVQSLEVTSAHTKFFVLLQGISVLLHLDPVRLEPSCTQPN